MKAPLSLYRENHAEYFIRRKNKIYHSQCSLIFICTDDCKRKKMLSLWSVFIAEKFIVKCYIDGIHCNKKTIIMETIKYVITYTWLYKWCNCANDAIIDLKLLKGITRNYQKITCKNLVNYKCIYCLFHKFHKRTTKQPISLPYCILRYRYLVRNSLLKIKEAFTPKNRTQIPISIIHMTDYRICFRAISWSEIRYMRNITI